jgi:Uncharacterized protein conserved in bacteria (DUF2188)
VDCAPSPSIPPAERRRSRDLWPFVVRLAASRVGRVPTYFFRVVERDDGSWLCRRGREEFDVHAQLDDAIEHTTGIASEHPPSQVFLHRLDGQVETIATLD